MEYVNIYIKQPSLGPDLPHECEYYMRNNTSLFSNFV